MLTDAQKIFNRLARADRLHQKEAGGSFLFRSIKYLLAFILAAFVLDVALHLTAGWRVGLLLALTAGAALLIATATYLAYVRRNRLEHIARLLESRDPALGSQLINLLQLQSQTTDPSLSPTTRHLARLAVDGYAANAMDRDFYRVARTGEVRRQFKRAAWTLLLFASLLAAFFKVTAVEVLRFADPFGDHPPYSFTQLQIRDPDAEGTNVIYGRSLLVKVATSGHRPKEVFLTAHPPGTPDQAITLPMFDKGTTGFHQQLENIRTDLILYAHTKNRLSRSRMAHVGVILTPQLERAHVRITPPAYTGLPPEERPYAFKAVQALAGSEVQFRLLSNRPLLEGTLEFSDGGPAPTRIPLTPTNGNEVAGAFVVERSGRLRFDLLDADRIPSQQSWEGALTVTHDLPPEVRIVEPEQDCFVAMDFKLDAVVEATDDYAIRSLRLHRALNDIYSVPRRTAYAPPTRALRETIPFDIASLGVQPGDVISLFAEVADGSPREQIARSQTVRLMVISVEDYNNFLREQTDLAETEAKYTLLQEDLQKLIEEQKQLGKQADALREQIAQPDSADREQLASALDRLLAQQNELNEKLTQHAGRMENFVRDNPLYDVEAELREYLRQQAETIRQSAATNNATAGNIGRQSSPPDAPRQISPELLSDFAQASEEQIERLGGVQEQTREQVLDTLAEMSRMHELMKDFNQFEALYRVQQQLAEQSQPYNRPGQLEREDQLALKALAATEQAVAVELQHLAEKLRADAQAAQASFPKAAKSGRDLADKMEELRLDVQARNATTAMLAADGQQAHQRSERLRSDMESLFSECQASGNCPSSGELDSFLSLQRGLKPGNNFAQMARSRNFTSPGLQPGLAFGQGVGPAGTSGYAIMDANAADVRGNERAAVRGREETRQAKIGLGEPGQPGDAGRDPEQKPDVIKDLNPVNRQSGAVQSESLIEEYNDVIQRYFEVLTTRPPP